MKHLLKTRASSCTKSGLRRVTSITSAPALLLAVVLGGCQSTPPRQAAAPVRTSDRTVAVLPVLPVPVPVPVEPDPAQGAAGTRTQTQRGAAGSTNASARRITIVAKNLEFHPARIHAAPGDRLQITLTNASDTAKHNIEFELPGGEVELPAPMPPGGQATLTLQAPEKPGEYVFYCPVANHHERGMEGRLVVGEPGRNSVTGNGAETGGEKPAPTGREPDAPERP